MQCRLPEASQWMGRERRGEERRGEEKRGKNDHLKYSVFLSTFHSQYNVCVYQIYPKRPDKTSCCLCQLHVTVSHDSNHSWSKHNISLRWGRSSAYRYYHTAPPWYTLPMHSTPTYHQLYLRSQMYRMWVWMYQHCLTKTPGIVHTQGRIHNQYHHKHPYLP